jgi:hypothetical protein
MPTAKILGFEFELPAPYASGHTCTLAEAEALNRLLVRGLAKGLHKIIDSRLNDAGAAKAGLSADQQADVTEAGLEYINEFVLGFSRGHDVARAIRLECDRLAKQALEVHLNRSGKSFADLSPNVLRSELAQLAKSEKIVTEANRRVAVTQEIALKAQAELQEALGDGATS